MAKNLAQKQAELEKIARQIAHCKICQKDSVGVAVPGEGSPNAKVVFLGEAPGKKEAETGRPFIGRAGKLLRQLLSEIQLSADEVYITSPVKYLPTYVTPTDDDIEHGFIHLSKQLKIIEPDVIVLMGRVAYKAILKENVAISTEHGKLIERGKTKYFLSYHPAAPLYSPKLRTVIQKDFQALSKILNK